MRAAGLRTRPYRISGRLSDFAAGPDRATHRARAADGWGFVLAGRGTAPALRLGPRVPKLRSLTQPSLVRAGRDAESARPCGPLPPSTLVHPRYWVVR
jgi:spermidine synthase